MATQLARNRVRKNRQTSDWRLFYSIFTLVSQSIYSKSPADVLNSSLDIGLVFWAHSLFQVIRTGSRDN